MPGALPSQTEKRIIATLPLHLPRGSRERTKGKAVWERAVPCGGEGPIRGTSPSPARTCQEYEWTSVPLRRHPRLAGWPSTATPTFLHLPSRWNSGKGRRAPRSQSSGVGSYWGLGTPRASRGPSVVWMQPHDVRAAGFLSSGSPLPSLSSQTPTWHSVLP